MPSPLVTCIIPVRDGARFVGEAIESVISQAHRPLELLVVEGGSIDDTRAVVAAFGDRVRLLDDVKGSAPAARNVGVARAAGELLCFLDADDRYRPGKVERQVAHLGRMPDVDVSLCWYESYWEPGLEAEEGRYRSVDRVRGSHSTITMLARRRVFDEVGLFDEAKPLADQVDWFERLGARTDLRVDVLPEVLVSRRMHASSLSHTAGTVEPWLDLLHERLRRRRQRRR